MDKFEISMFVDAIGQTSIPIVGLTRGPMAIKLQHMQDGESHYAGTLFVEVEVSDAPFAALSCHRFNRAPLSRDVARNHETCATFTAEKIPLLRNLQPIE
jgi:hypothetical protein